MTEREGESPSGENSCNLVEWEGAELNGAHFKEADVYGEEIGAQPVSNIFPETTDDERDPREDQNEDRRREEEIKGDRPPHHEG